MERLTPEISIIIPAYNEEQVIKETIDSIQSAQNAHMSEIIVVCNGCTDQTEDIALEAGARVIIAPEKGAATASNFGSEHAMGQTLVFLDADTTVAPNLLNETKKAVDDGYIGGRTVVRWDGAGILSRLFSLVSYFHRYKWGGFCFVDKDLFREIGGYRDGEYGFDFDLAQRVSKRGKTAFLWRSHVLTSARRFEEEGWIKHLFLAAKRYYLDHVVRGSGVKSEEEIDYSDFR